MLRTIVLKSSYRIQLGESLRPPAILPHPARDDQPGAGQQSMKKSTVLGDQVELVELSTIKSYISVLLLDIPVDSELSRTI